MLQRLTNEQKKQICDRAEACPLSSQEELAKWAQREFGLPKLSQPTICKILKRRDDFETMTAKQLAAKRLRPVKYPLVEEAMATWVLQCQAKNIKLTHDLIKEKARRFANIFGVPSTGLDFSNRWMQKFQRRYGFRKIKTPGEAASADDAAIDAELPRLQALVASYHPRDVFNMDETGKSLLSRPNLKAIAITYASAQASFIA
jgi:Tc5 transposase DNA-binding domain/Fission yeast centromere protein N-terminal domain